MIKRLFLFLLLLSLFNVSLFAVGTVVFSDTFPNLNNWIVTPNTVLDSIYWSPAAGGPCMRVDNTSSGVTTTAEISLTDLSGYDLIWINFRTSGWYGSSETPLKIQTFNDSSWVTRRTVSYTDLGAGGGSGYINIQLTTATFNKIRFSLDASPASQWYVDDFTMVGDNKPVLSFTGAAGYSSDGVEPDYATILSTPTFCIRYTDNNNDSPAGGGPKLYILKGGSEIAGSPFTMVATDAGDTTYNDGKDYKYSIWLSTGNEYSYYFTSNDTWIASDSTTVLSGPIVDLVSISGTIRSPDSTPMLNVKVNLSGDSSSTTYTNSLGQYQFKVTAGLNYVVTPSSYAYYSFNPSTYSYVSFSTVVVNADFIRINSTNSAELSYTLPYNALLSSITALNIPNTFYVLYKDPENDPPAAGYPKLCLYKDGVPVAGSPFAMTYLSGVLLNGATFSYAYSFIQKGNDYTYFVQCYDVYNTSSSAPTTKAGPIVSQFPTISFPGYSGYSADFINPDNGDISSIFTYRAVYTDEDNDPPAAGYPKVHILKGGAEIAGSPFVMLQTDGTDINYTNGKEYFYQISLAAGADYSYFVTAYDVWTASATSSIYNGPYIGVCVKGAVYDPLGGPLPGIKVLLTGYETDTQLTDTEGKYSFVVSTNNYGVFPSTYSYYSFNPTSYSYLNITTTINNQDFTRVNYAPSFVSPQDFTYGINYRTLYTTDTVTFSLLFKDQDNDPPSADSLKVIIKSSNTVVSTFTLKPSGADYRAGVVCSSSTSFGKVGHFTYSFEGKDMWDAPGTIEDIYDLNDLYFDIIDVPPSGFANTSQLAVNGGGVVSSKVVLSWNAADPGGGPVIYSLYISNDSTFFAPVKRNAPEIGSNMTCVYTGSLTSFSLENLPAGKTFYWQVMATNSRGASAVSPVWSFNTVSLAPTSTRNYPNPFNPSSGPTRIAFSSTKSQAVKIYIYSEIGDLIFTDDFAAVAGTNEYVYRGLDSAGNTLYNGTYICRIIKEDGIATCNLMVIK